MRNCYTLANAEQQHFQLRVYPTGLLVYNSPTGSQHLGGSVSYVTMIGSGHDLMVGELCAGRAEPAGDSLSLPLKINVKKNNNYSPSRSPPSLYKREVPSALFSGFNCGFAVACMSQMVIVCCS